MIYTFRVKTPTDMAVASQAAEELGLGFTMQSNDTFDLSVMEAWKLDFFHSKLGHSEVITSGGKA